MLGPRMVVHECSLAMYLDLYASHLKLLARRDVPEWQGRNVVFCVLRRPRQPWGCPSRTARNCFAQHRCQGEPWLSGAPEDEVLVAKSRALRPSRSRKNGVNAALARRKFSARGFRGQHNIRRRCQQQRARKKEPADMEISPEHAWLSSRTERNRGPAPAAKAPATPPDVPLIMPPPSGPARVTPAYAAADAERVTQVPGRAVVPPARPRAAAFTSTASTHGTAPTGPSATGTTDE